MNLFKVIQIGFTVLEWYEQASEDDHITAKEIAELVTKVASSTELAQVMNIEL